MNWKPVLAAAGTALLTLATWWVGILYLDGTLSTMLPYDQYQQVALLYPEIYYPALPGWILATSQPFAFGVWLVALGWMLILSAAIGAAATRYPVVSRSSPVATAVGFVVILFVAVTILEAVVSLVA